MVSCVDNPTTERLGQEDSFELKVSLSYRMKHCLENKRKKGREKKMERGERGREGRT